jgi:hypothetical protein
MAELKDASKGTRAPGADAGTTIRRAKDAIESAKISSAVYVFRAGNCQDLHSTIFAMDATKRGFVQTVSCIPENPDMQILRDCCEGGRIIEEMKRTLSKWSSYASIGGVAQYSLKKRAPVFTSKLAPAGVLGKFDIEFRPASLVEAYADLDNYGEQVILKTWAEAGEREKRTGTKIKALGEEFLYAGPLRMAGFHFTTRVFQGGFPDDISQAIEEVNGNAPKGELIVHQAYYFFHADNGRIMYSAFRKPEDYCAGKTKLFGDITISDGKLTFFQNGNKENAKDFSGLLMGERVD